MITEKCISKVNYYLLPKNCHLFQHDDIFLFGYVSVEKGVELDSNWVEFGDIRYHIQVSRRFGTFSFHVSMVENETI